CLAFAVLYSGWCGIYPRASRGACGSCYGVEVRITTMSAPTRGFVLIGRLVLAFSAAALAVTAQSLAVDKQADLVIRSTTRLVQMSVVAQDKHGRPVVDLKKE